MVVNQTQRVKWPDLSAYALKMVIVKLPTGENRLLMLNGNTHAERIKKIGFKRIGDFWLRDNSRIGKGELQSVFPNMRIVEMDRDDVFKVAVRKHDRANVANINQGSTGNKEIDDEIKARVQVSASVFIGKNYLGQDVYESIEGRYIKGGESSVTSESQSTQAIYLRAATDADLELCADGLVAEILEGRYFRKDDVDSFVETVLGEQAKDPIRTKRLHDAISHALSRSMTSGIVDSGPDAYALAIKLHEGLPALNEERAERITPLPIGVVSQRLIAGAPGRHIYIPQLANGSLTSALDGYTILTNEFPGEAMSHVEAKSDVEVFDGIPSHDIMAANLTYSTLDKQESVLGIKTDRKDHAEVIRALDKRTAKGRTVVMLKADEETKQFISTIASSHMIDGVVEVDSSLFGKGGASNGRLLICIGSVGGCDFNPNTIKKVYDFKSLWDWSDHLVSEDQKKLEKKDHVENGYQSPYVPASNAIENPCMIPRNLAGPTHKALANVQSRHGDIDAFVARELQLKEEDLSKFFDAAQVDALALAIDAHYRDRYFIEADQTGMGKGRVLAGMARFAILKGMKTIFITERPTLFSDFYRDIVDTGNDELFDFFTFNLNQNIYMDGKKVKGAESKEAVLECIASREVPDDKNMVIATYSQFNRPSTKDNPNEKVEWLINASKGAFLILDESHNAGGDSNTGENLHRAILNAGGCVYSSATYAKDPNNFFIYSKVMPPSVPSSSVPTVLSRGGEPLSEVFSAMLAEDGVMIRREHDLSNLRFEAEVDYAHMERNEMLANKLAEILDAFGVISGEVNNFLDDRNKLIKANLKEAAKGQKKSKMADIKKIGWRGTGIGSIMYAAMRQFMMAIKTDMATEMAVKALNEGRKPVIVVENTMEALILSAVDQDNELFDIETEFEEDLLEAATTTTESSEMDAVVADFNSAAAIELSKAKRVNDGQVLSVPVTFNNVLHKILDRMFTIKKINNGKVEASERIELQQAIKLRQTVEMMIDAFPELNISPIDIIKSRINQAGYSCGEISGRSVGVINQDDGSQVIHKIKGSNNKTKVIYDFNEGYLDALVLTTAGSTGISLHSSRKFTDQRTREMVELQIPNNVATRVQTFGRVNRKDQRCPPIIRTLVSGLPSEIRLLSMQNSKLREMSANTTSNRNNSILSNDFPDLLNKVGSKVCLDFMQNNMDIVHKLCIPVERLTEDCWRKEPIFHANILTQRLGMLSVERQRLIYDEIGKFYDMEINDLTQRGVNPFKTSDMDVKATVINEEVVYKTALNTGSVFDAPIVARDIQYTHYFDCVDLAKLNEEIQKSKENFTSLLGENTYGDAVRAYEAKLEEVRGYLMSKALSKDFDDVKEAMAAEGENAVKTASAKIDVIKRLLRQLEPGREVTFTDFFSPVKGVVSSIRIPKKGGEHMLSAYEVRIQVPGDRATSASLYSLFNDQNFSSDAATRETLLKFSEVKKGSMQVTRQVLGGNMYEAASWSATRGSGTSVIYTDDAGDRHRAIILPHSAPRVRTINADVPVNKQIASYLLNSNLDMKVSTDSSYNDKKTYYIRINKSGECYLGVPSGKAGAILLSNSRVHSLQSYQLDKRGVIKSQVIKFDRLELDDIIDEIYSMGMILYVHESFAEEVSRLNELNKNEVLEDLGIDPSVNAMARNVAIA